MIPQFLVEFVGHAPENYEYLEYTFSCVVFMSLIIVLVVFMLIILYSFITFFKGGDSL